MCSTSTDWQQQLYSEGACTKDDDGDGDAFLMVLVIINRSNNNNIADNVYGAVIMT